MRVFESSSRRLPSETTERPESPSQDDTNGGKERPNAPTDDDAQPSTSNGQRSATVSPLHIAALSVRSEMWPSVSNEALLGSLDEPSELSSSQSSRSPTTSANPSTSSASARSGDSWTSSPGSRNTSEDPVAVQRRYRYIRSRIPVRGHSFCTCLDSPNRTEGRFLECLCGEENGSST